MTVLLVAVLVLNLIVLALLVLLLQRQGRAADPEAALARIGSDMLSLERGLSQSFAVATADIAKRLEQTKGDLRQEVSDRISNGFKEIHTSVENQLATGRREQSAGLAESRTELTASLASTTAQLKVEFDGLNKRTEDKLEAIRGQVDQKLLEIGGQVQQKLTENMKEGFAQFEKVQQHLKAAEEQLREVRDRKSTRLNSSHRL